jgi:hypothetical protein
VVHNQLLGLRLHSCSDSLSATCLAASAVAAVACSLPSLRSLEVTVEGTLHALPMSTVPYSLRSQLSGLQSLNLDLKQSWAGASAVWRELGRLTQLTALHMMVQGEVRGTGLGGFRFRF